MPAATISIPAPTSCAGSASVRSGWYGSIRKAAWPGALAIPKCRVTRPFAASCANAPPQSSSSARCRISWRRSSTNRASRISHSGPQPKYPFDSIRPFLTEHARGDANGLAIHRIDFARGRGHRLRTAIQILRSVEIAQHQKGLGLGGESPLGFLGLRTMSLRHCGHLAHGGWSIGIWRRGDQIKERDVDGVIVGLGVIVGRHRSLERVRIEFLRAIEIALLTSDKPPPLKSAGQDSLRIRGRPAALEIFDQHLKRFVSLSDTFERKRKTCKRVAVDFVRLRQQGVDRLLEIAELDGNPRAIARGPSLLRTADEGIHHERKARVLCVLRLDDFEMVAGNHGPELIGKRLNR